MFRASARCASAVLAIASIVGAGWAEPPPLERQLITETGKAVGQSVLGNTADAIASCEGMHKLITPGAPAWLNFYVERCLAAVSEPGGVMGGARCPHYKAEIEIWRASPPPVDPDDEDGAIVRAKSLRQAKEDLARHCTPGAPAPRPADPEAMAIAPASGGTLQTQEGLAYAMPAGFGVKSFDPDSGLAILRDPSSDLIFRIERKGLNDRSARGFDYPDKETMPSGAVLQWEYKEFLPGSNSYVLYGRVTLPNAYVMLGISTGAKSGDKSVDKAAGLDLFRKIAGTVRVVGPRCVGDCKPGVLKPG